MSGVKQFDLLVKAIQLGNELQARQILKVNHYDVDFLALLNNLPLDSFVRLECAVVDHSMSYVLRFLTRLDRVDLLSDFSALDLAIRQKKWSELGILFDCCLKRESQDFNEKVLARAAVGLEIQAPEDFNGLAQLSVQHPCFLEVLIQQHQRKKTLFALDFGCFAIKNGQVHLLKMIVQQVGYVDIRLIERVAANRHAEMLVFLLESALTQENYTDLLKTAVMALGYSIDIYFLERFFFVVSRPQVRSNLIETWVKTVFFSGKSLDQISSDQAQLDFRVHVWVDHTNKKVEKTLAVIPTKIPGWIERLMETCFSDPHFNILDLQPMVLSEIKPKNFDLWASVEDRQGIADLDSKLEGAKKDHKEYLSTLERAQVSPHRCARPRRALLNKVRTGEAANQNLSELSVSFLSVLVFTLEKEIEGLSIRAKQDKIQAMVARQREACKAYLNGIWPLLLFLFSIQQGLPYTQRFLLDLARAQFLDEAQTSAETHADPALPAAEASLEIPEQPLPYKIFTPKIFFEHQGALMIKLAVALKRFEMAAFLVDQVQHTEDFVLLNTLVLSSLRIEQFDDFLSLVRTGRSDWLIQCCKSEERLHEMKEALACELALNSTVPFDLMRFAIQRNDLILQGFLLSAGLPLSENLKMVIASKWDGSKYDITDWQNLCRYPHSLINFYLAHFKNILDNFLAQVPPQLEREVVLAAARTAYLPLLLLLEQHIALKHYQTDVLIAVMQRGSSEFFDQIVAHIGPSESLVSHGDLLLQAAELNVEQHPAAVSAIHFACCRAQVNYKNNEALARAAERGHIPTLALLRAKGAQFKTGDILIRAVGALQVPTLEWVLDSSAMRTECKGQWEQALNLAYALGSAQIIKLMHLKLKLPMSINHLKIALLNGHTEVVPASMLDKRFKELYSERDPRLLYDILASGNQTAFFYFLEHIVRVCWNGLNQEIYGEGIIFAQDRLRIIGHALGLSGCEDPKWITVRDTLIPRFPESEQQSFLNGLYSGLVAKGDPVALRRVIATPGNTNQFLIAPTLGFLNEIMMAGHLQMMSYFITTFPSSWSLEGNQGFADPSLNFDQEFSPLEKLISLAASRFDYSGFNFLLEHLVGRNLTCDSIPKLIQYIFYHVDYIKEKLAFLLFACMLKSLWSKKRGEPEEVLRLLFIRWFSSEKWALLERVSALLRQEKKTIAVIDTSLNSAAVSLNFIRYFAINMGLNPGVRNEDALNIILDLCGGLNQHLRSQSAEATAFYSRSSLLACHGKPLSVSPPEQLQHINYALFERYPAFIAFGHVLAIARMYRCLDHYESQYFNFSSLSEKRAFLLNPSEPLAVLSHLLLKMSYNLAHQRPFVLKIDRIVMGVEAIIARLNKAALAPAEMTQVASDLVELNLFQPPSNQAVVLFGMQSAKALPQLIACVKGIQLHMQALKDLMESHRQDRPKRSAVFSFFFAKTQESCLRVNPADLEVVF